jgi:hypothetical protein
MSIGALHWLTCPLQELDAAVELVSTSRLVAAGLWAGAQHDGSMEGNETKQVSGESSTAESTTAGSSTGSNLALLGKMGTSSGRRSKLS